MKKFALVSVSDKRNLKELSFFLLSNSYTILSTGGTYSKLIEFNGESGSILQISNITDFPEILGGRVKTLHPKISGGILASSKNHLHMLELEKYNIPKISIVIVNLYPFSEVINHPNCSEDQAIENIDIGGHTLIRESVKNYEDTLLLTDPEDYHIIESLDKITVKERLNYAKKGLSYVIEYDICISNYFSSNTIYRKYSKALDFKYGCNPHQTESSLYSIDKSPIKILNGNMGYINMIDALHSWQLVKELSEALDLPAAASFKHTSPAGVGTGVLLNDTLKRIYDVENMELSQLAIAFIRARYTDPMSSFGDFISLSHIVDISTAKLIKREISDGVIAPGYTPEALEILVNKRGGKYLILEVDPDYNNEQSVEIKEIYGMAISQQPNNYKTDISSVLNIQTKNKHITTDAMRDMIIANISLKYAQSNNVAFAYGGQLIGLAAGQQNRVDCVRLAGDKARRWCLMQHPDVIRLKDKFKVGVKRQDKINASIRYIQGDFSDIEYNYWKEFFEEIPSNLSEESKDNYLSNFNEVSMASDAFFPFRDNIDFAAKYGVKYILQPGGSVADKGVIEACDQYGIMMSFSGNRLFYH